jgi:hypothetical protein
MDKPGSSLFLLFLVCLLVGACFVGSVSANFIEYKPPKLEILSPAETGDYNSNVPLILNITITPKLTGWERITNLTYSLDGNPMVALLLPDEDVESNNYVTDVLYGLSDGTHTLTVLGLTSVGNIFNSTVNFNVKTQAPDYTPLQIIPLTPTNTTYLGNAVRLNFWVNKPILWVQYSLNNAENATLIANYTLVPCNLGTNTLTLYAADEEGNVAASKTITFSMFEFHFNSQYEQLLPLPLCPIISVFEPQNYTYNQSSVPLTFTLNQPVILDSTMLSFSLGGLTATYPDVSWVGYSLDGQTNQTLTGNTTLSGLTSGTHNVTVYAKDVYGNIGSSGTIFFAVEQSFPVVAVIVGVSTVIIICAVSIIYLKKR